MEPFFQWLGDFWWLVFPLMGVMGGIGSAWERAARRRHQRRLEILHAKAEIKAAQAAARGKPLPASLSRPAQSARPESLATQLERLFAAHDEVTRRWLEYELDVAKLIAYPAMSDGRQPLTAAFLRAKKAADNVRPESAAAKVTADQLAEYRSAVTDFEVAFDVAERDARRIKDSSFTVAERKRLDVAKQLLTVAIDQAATPAERQVAYRRVREELDGLISLSDDAIEVLEQKVALELTTGASPVVDAAGAPPQPRLAPPRPPAAPAEPPAPQPKSGPWPVPARTTNTAPGRVVRPKPHP
ncbi:MAG: hypothetical protein QM611_10865 [Microbacterium sp.]|uniref:hypothetical protein n=1 Tax=Microbacterium sp. TaxID=51671 RepID=UPI0039E39F58